MKPSLHSPICHTYVLFEKDGIEVVEQRPEHDHVEDAVDSCDHNHHGQLGHVLDLNQRGDAQQDQVTHVDEEVWIGAGDVIGTEELQPCRIQQGMFRSLHVALELKDTARSLS